MKEEFLAELREIGPVRLDERLSRHTTFGIGGPADAYFRAKSEEDLRRAFACAHSHGVPVFVFGSGSNLLVGDGGIRGLTIDNSADAVDGPMQNGTGLKVHAASGVSFAALARRMCSDGYAGLEWACGIPGSLGGAVVTNAGAYGSSLADVLRSVRMATADGDVVDLDPEDLGLTYRNSGFTRGEFTDRIVLGVDLRVAPGDSVALRARVREFDTQRKAAQPPGQNCGSVFKNPGTEHGSWWYVDQVGLRGHTIGGAQISQKHTNFIENIGGATARDVTSLIEIARERIKERFGIDMETEVQMAGEFL